MGESTLLGQHSNVSCWPQLAVQQIADPLAGFAPVLL